MGDARQPVPRWALLCPGVMPSLVSASERASRRGNANRARSASITLRKPVVILTLAILRLALRLVASRRRVAAARHGG